MKNLATKVCRYKISSYICRVIINNNNLKRRKMKVFANIHNVEHLDNRSKVTFNIGGNHNDYVELFNKVVAIERKYNAQSTIYSNKSSLVFDKNANVIGLTDGNSGGTVTFHSHSCNPKEAATELVELLESVK